MSDFFFFGGRGKIVQNSISAGTLPQTQFGELTAHPDP